MPFEDDSLGGKDRILWENYNPYPKFADVLYPEFIFVDANCGASEPFYQGDPISSKLQQLFFACGGYIDTLNYCELKNRKFQPLVSAGTQQGGTVAVSAMITHAFWARCSIPIARKNTAQEKDKEGRLCWPLIFKATLPRSHRTELRRA